MFAHQIDDTLFVREIALQDAEKVFHLTEESRSYLRKFLPWLDFTINVEDTQIFIQGSIEKNDRKEGLTTVIIYKDKIGGVTGFNELDWGNKTAYIGYWLGEKYQGKGIMTKTVRVLTDYAFRHLNMNKVDIRAALENEKSQAVPKRLGFRREGLVNQAEWLYDRYVDHVIYGMLREEWFDKQRESF